MRTTLAIDDDVLAAARALAEAQDRPLGAVISDLARKALDRPLAQGTRNGLPLLSRPAGAALPAVTPDLVAALRDDPGPAA